jgi:hypothetical protein
MSLQSDIPDDTGPLTIDEALERRAALSSVADEIDDDEPANPDPAPVVPADADVLPSLSKASPRKTSTRAKRRNRRLRSQPSRRPRAQLLER